MGYDVLYQNNYYKNIFQFTYTLLQNIIKLELLFVYCENSIFKYDTLLN